MDRAKPSAQVLRDTLAFASSRLGTLSREEAARAALALLRVETQLEPRGSPFGQTRQSALLAEYAGLRPRFASKVGTGAVVLVKQDGAWRAVELTAVQVFADSAPPFRTCEAVLARRGAAQAVLGSTGVTGGRLFDSVRRGS